MTPPKRPPAAPPQGAVDTPTPEAAAGRSPHEGAAPPDRRSRIRAKTLWSGKKHDSLLSLAGLIGTQILQYDLAQGQIVASGGRVTSADCSCSWHATASVSSPQPLPTSEPA